MLFGTELGGYVNEVAALHSDHYTVVSLYVYNVHVFFFYS